MKHTRSYLFIAVSSIALVVILIIQVNWIIQTARIKKEIFDEKANMVLSRATEALYANKQACRNIEETLSMDTSPASKTKLRSNEAQTIDSLFRHYMQVYNFHIDYTFEVLKQPLVATNYGSGFGGNTYNRKLDALNTGGIELKLILPDKKKFIIEEMGVLFITSVILILVVLVLFWQTVLSLLKEKQLSEGITDFLNNMTHEFKTPLTNIALAGKMIQKDPAITGMDKVKHYSDIILEENKKLAFQVEQVLGMTALERGEIHLRKSETNLHELLLESVKQMSLQIEHRKGSMKVITEAENYHILCDRVHLTNAICNLIDNAIKYSNGKPEITLETYNRGASLIINIKDKGIGIDREYHQKIFEKFFRVPTGDVHDVKGFGLGLAYVKKIVELHHGILEMQSEKGKGTSFTLIFANE